MFDFSSDSYGVLTSNKNELAVRGSGQGVGAVAGGSAECWCRELAVGPSHP